ncbi:hypothetical protein, partial [Paenibacillus ferrarius]|uniref:hypothetical protein n=1 Tax=Paenibacillus ferrarius TaxID=1469647 RepID=UPI003D2E8270
LVNQQAWKCSSSFQGKRQKRVHELEFLQFVGALSGIFGAVSGMSWRFSSSVAVQGALVPNELEVFQLSGRSGHIGAK